jgi:hypothetical protein
LRISRLQIVVFGLVLALAIVFFVADTRDSNLQRWMRGECTLQPGGIKWARFNCPPRHASEMTDRGGADVRP